MKAAGSPPYQSARAVDAPTDTPSNAPAVAVTAVIVFDDDAKIERFISLSL